MLVSGATWLDTANQPDANDRDGNDRTRANDGPKVQTTYLSAVGIPDEQESALWDLFHTAEDGALQGPDGVVTSGQPGGTQLCCGTYYRRTSTNDDNWKWHEHADQNEAATFTEPYTWDYVDITGSEPVSVVFVAHEDSGSLPDGDRDGRLFDGTPYTGCGTWDTATETWADDRDECEVFYIECDPSTGDIKEIDLERAQLGSQQSEVIPNSIGEFTALIKLDLADNQWTGMSTNIQHLDSLITLDLHLNMISQPAETIFAALSQVGPDGSATTSLRNVNLNNNRIHGALPAFGARLGPLEKLDLGHNELSGALPDDTFSHLTSMKEFSLSQNRDITGNVHEDFALMSSLEKLDIEDTGFTGELFEFTNFALLQELHASGCSFTGALPASIGNAISLQVLDLEHSDLSGPLDPGIINCGSLRTLNLAHNAFDGPLPTQCVETAGSVPADAALCAAVELGTDTSRAQCEAVQRTDGGGAACTFQSLLSNTGSMQQLDLSYNSFEGSIADLLDMLPASYPTLTQFNLEENRFDGAIPASLSKLGNVMDMRLAGNQFTSLPASDLSLVLCSHFDVHDNKIAGALPSLSGLTRLAYLDVYDNLLTGGLGDMSQQCMLLSIDAHDNSLTELGQLPTSIKTADFDDNQIAIDVASIGLSDAHCALHSLEIERNQLSGDLGSLSALPALRKLKAGFNSLSGDFPNFSPRMAWAELNDNALTGDVSNFYCSDRLPANDCRVNTNLPYDAVEGRCRNFPGTGIPVTFQQVTDLQKLTLNVKNNQLTGVPGCPAVPDWLDQDLSAVSLNVANNLIQGPFQPVDSVLLPKLAAIDLSNNDLGTPADGVTGEDLAWLSRLGQEDCTAATPADAVACAAVPRGTATTQTECVAAGCTYIAGSQLGANNGISIKLANNSLGLHINDFEQYLDFETVQFIDLSGNDLTGTLEPLGRLVNLKLLNLENNNLGGTLDGLGALWATWHSVHEVLTPEICQQYDCAAPADLETTCSETATGAESVAEDATACSNVVLGTPTAKADCEAVTTAANSDISACTFSTLCPSGCTLAGTGAAETCTIPQNDCTTGYTVGDPNSPSTTCPEGCFFQPATARSNAKTTTDYLDVYVANNQFTGGVEFLTQDHNNMHLEHLDLSGNLLSGEVPYNLWRSDLHRILLNDNSFTGAIPMLRPDCEHWMGSVADVQSASSNPIRDDWANVRLSLENLNQDWCKINVAQTGQSDVCNEPVADAAACDAACLAATLVVIPQKPTQQAGWHIWKDICSTGLAFGPGVHSGQCQVCTSFEPAGCEDLDDDSPCECTFFAAPTQDCINQCIVSHCESVFQNREYCQQPQACHLAVDLSGNDWSCPAPRLPPGDNSGFTMQLSKEEPWVNPVYQSADCTCAAGSTCTGDGRSSNTVETSTANQCRAFCKPCQRGFFSDETDADGCDQCQSGKYSDFEGQTACSECQPGRIGAATYTDESASPPVDRTVEIRNSEAISCEECVPGTYQTQAAQISCELAEVGNSAPFTGMNYTIPCEPGSFAAEEGAVQCDFCPAGKYQNATGSDDCSDCPEGTVTRFGGAAQEVQCNDPLLANEFCPKGSFANRAAYDADGVLLCIKARPGRYVTWEGPSVVQWEEDGAEQLCSDQGNFIAAKPGSTGCTECVDNTYANTEQGSGSLEGNTNYVCLPCGIFGTESEYCAANLLSIGVLAGCVLLLLGALAFKISTRHDEEMSDSSDSDEEFGGASNAAYQAAD